MNTANIEIQKADSENACTRERRYARGERGGAVCLDIARDYWHGRRIAIVVTWNANDGRGWRKLGWKATFASQEAAEAFAASKWTVLVAWLEKLEPHFVPFSPDFTC